MRIFYYLALVIIALAGIYTVVGIVNFKWMHHSVENPKAEFLTYESGDGVADEITVVEFLNYGCGYCKQMHPTVKELLALRKDIKYIVRPVVFGTEEMLRLNNMVLAAGLQGKFWEMHDAVLEYPEQDVPDSFIEETASLYGIDFDKLVSDSQSIEIENIARNNMGSMRHASISSVPSFVINGEVYVINDEYLPNLKDMIKIIANAKK